MIHREEYYTCDRCGEIIETKFIFGIPVKRTREYALKTYSPEFKTSISENNSSSDGKTAMEITLYDNSMLYSLCYKCRKDFERFMKNEV